MSEPKKITQKNQLIAELRLALKVARACNRTGMKWVKGSAFDLKMKELLSIKLRGLK